MINLGQVLGRVGKIENKTSATGVKFANLSLVTSKKFTKNGEKQEKVTWHNVTLFNKLAEIAEKYVAVGDNLYIRGEMDTQTYTPEDGIKRTRSFIIGHDLQLMPKSKEHAPKKSESSGNTIEDDEIPW